MTDSDNKPLGTLTHHVFHNEKMDEERTISDSKYADKKEFGLVQKIVFGMITLILVAVLTGMLALVVNKP